MKKFTLNQNTALILMKEIGINSFFLQIRRSKLPHMENVSRVFNFVNDMFWKITSGFYFAKVYISSEEKIRKHDVFIEVTCTFRTYLNFWYRISLNKHPPRSKKHPVQLNIFSWVPPLNKNPQTLISTMLGEICASCCKLVPP